MERLIFVSADSHATPQPDVWPDYIEKKYHYLLDEAHEDNKKYTNILSLFSNFAPELLEIIDTDGAWRAGGYLGCWDADVRLKEMDREGCAAELVYAGDPRAALPLTQIYRNYPQEIVAAGGRAYNRWAADVFGGGLDRILIAGDPSVMVTLPDMLAELKWMSEHGFSAAHLPMGTARHDLPPLYDGFWDTYWSACEEYNFPLICHAGYGGEPCEFFSKVEDIKTKMEVEGRTDLLNEIINNAAGFFSLDLRPRRAMWQMMLGGVFDRHPDLKLIMAEVRGDWMPATLAHLDVVFDRHRTDVRARKPPSEYWSTNGLTSLSFIHKAEVGMRHDIGMHQIAIGRDYPHAEGTWPNSRDWINDVFQGVPDEELKLMLGENAIRVLGLDRDRLAKIASRIGPTIADITGRKPELDPRMIENWDARGGYLRPVEVVDHAAIDALLERDLAATGG
jgi:predicted TIM-barrel fold metal-dependent hydrolase